MNIKSIDFTEELILDDSGTIRYRLEVWCDCFGCNSGHPHNVGYFIFPERDTNIAMKIIDFIRMIHKDGKKGTI